MSNPAPPSSAPAMCRMPLTSFLAAVYVILAVLVDPTSGYSSGAPASACSYGRPGGGSGSSTTHGTLQSGDGGFSLNFSPSITSGYTPNQQYTVTLSGSISFVGFLVYVVDGALSSGTNTRLTCSDNGVTHTKILGVTSISFQWTAPSSGSVSFRTTTLDQRDSSTGRFWIFDTTVDAAAPATTTAATTTTTTTNKCSAVPVDCAALNRTACEFSSTPDTCGPCLDGFYEINGNRTDKNTDSCRPCDDACQTCEDSTKACTVCKPGYERSPLLCEPIPEKNFSQGSALRTQDCTFDCPVEARWGRDGTKMHFEIVVRGFSNVRWAAIGFSTTPRMTNSDVLSAHMDEVGQITVMNRWASQYSQPDADADQSGIDGAAGTLNSTTFQVEFSRQLAPINSNDADFTDTAKTFYVLVAFGTGTFNKHGSSGTSSAPIVSADPVNLRSSADVASANPTNARDATIVHGVLMLCAWVLLSPSAIFVAHNLKFVGPSWFTVHKYLQLGAILLTVAGIIVIFADLGEFQMGTHEVLGILVLTFCLFQGLLGLTRNWISGQDSDSKDSEDHGPRRWLFNYLHWTFGAVTSVLAIVTIFFGLDKLGADNDAFIVLYVWLAVDGAVALVVAIMNAGDVNTENHLIIATCFFVAVGAAATVTTSVLIEETPEFE